MQRRGALAEPHSRKDSPKKPLCDYVPAAVSSCCCTRYGCIGWTSAQCNLTERVHADNGCIAHIILIFTLVTFLNVSA